MSELGEVETQALSLFEQTKDRIGNFGRRRKPGDVFIIVNRGLEAEGKSRATREQIQKILESTPNVFSEDWTAPPGKLALYPHRLPENQRQVFEELQGLGPKISGQQIEAVIRRAKAFREHSAAA